MRRVWRPDGWVVLKFELTTSVGESLTNQVEFPLPPGSYRLALAVKDVARGKAGTKFTTIEVPSLE